MAVIAFLLIVGLAGGWFARALAEAVGTLRGYYRDEKRRRGIQ